MRGNAPEAQALQREPLSIDGSLSHIAEVANDALFDSMDPFRGPLIRTNPQTHPDFWANELPIYVDALLVDAELKPENVAIARQHVEFWLDNIDQDGRIPHMIINSLPFSLTALRNIKDRDVRNGLRRTIFDRRVQKSYKNEQDNYISSKTGAPVLSIAALRVAEAMPAGEREAWIEKIYPMLVHVKAKQYEDSKDALPLQTNPDETLQRGNQLNEHLSSQIELSPRQERFVKTFSESKIFQKFSNAFRRYQGKDTVNVGENSYDSEKLMKLHPALKMWVNFFADKKQFAAQDVAIAALFVKDNSAFQKISDMIWRPNVFEDDFKQSEAAFREMQDEETGRFVSRDGAGDLRPELTAVESCVALVGRSALSGAEVTGIIDDIQTRIEDTEVPLHTGLTAEDDMSKVEMGAVNPLINWLVWNELNSGGDSLREQRLKHEIGDRTLQLVVQPELDKVNLQQKTRFSKALDRILKRSQANTVPDVLCVDKFARAYDARTGRAVGGQNYWSPTAAVIKICSKK